ncbi:MAG: GxxExxY protein [Bacteroidetes bacterium]|nr:GxxExxY protein [Bacteroidota bacterium]
MNEHTTTKQNAEFKRSDSNAFATGAAKTENEIATLILDCALELHRKLGPGLLESAYEASLMHLLLKKGLYAEHQKALPLVYEEVKLDAGYRVDILVEKKVIVEVKSVEALNEVHLAQVMTYLKLSKCKLGLLINFNSVKVMDGVRRVVNKL